MLLFIYTHLHYASASHSPSFIAVFTPLGFILIQFLHLFICLFVYSFVYVSLCLSVLV